MTIEVDRSYLINTAKEIESYIDNLIVYMRTSSREVYILTSKSWKSMDGKVFYQKWMEQTDKDSVTEHVKANLRSYAKSLRNAEKKYKDAQANAFNKEFLSEVLPL